MKRVILITIISFVLCLSVSINSLASGIGGALDVIQGSNIDPRTDSRYADKFNLDNTVAVHQKILEGSPEHGDVVMEFTISDGDKSYRLKAYARLWYDDSISEIGKPCVYLNEDATINGYGPYNIPTFWYGTSSMNDFYTAMINEYERTDYTFSQYTENRNRSGSSYMFSYYSTPKDIEILSSDFPVFTDMDDVNYYRETGIIRNAKYDPNPKDYSAELYFKSFDVIPHASNSVDYYYFDIKYELSDYAKKNIDKLNLNFENRYRWETLSDITSSGDLYKDTGWLSNSISLKDRPYGFTIMVNDLSCYHRIVNEWGLPSSSFVGESRVMDISNSVLHTILPGTDIISISQACLYFRFNLRFSGSNGVVVGKRNDFTYDFLNKKLEKYIYTPDTSTDGNGNTTFVKDSNGNITYTQEGDMITSGDYYYNKVTEITEGDTVTTTNNFYYYDKDGNEKEITKDEYDNNAFTVVNVDGGNASAEGGNAIANASASIGDIIVNIPSLGSGGGSSGNNITIEDDDLTSDGIISAISHGFGYFDNIDTGEKGDGLVALISGLYGYLPADLASMTLFGIATVFGIAIIRIIIKR